MSNIQTQELVKSLDNLNTAMPQGSNGRTIADSLSVLIKSKLQHHTVPEKQSTSGTVLKFPESKCD